MITLATHKAVSGRTGRHRPGLWLRLIQYVAVARQRRTLIALNDHLLDDSGITRDQAAAEARRKIWDVPATWQDHS